MIAFDTNILLPAIESGNPHHTAAASFVQSLQHRDDVVLSEFILLELYVLLRNPAVLARPLSASAAAETCEAFRSHPRWQVLGFPPESRAFHDALWPRLRSDQFARRRAYDWRAALCLLQQGVTEFATVNVKDFQDFGFAKVWNPL
ncbi:MAG TPA: PIN domain-containing protein [Chthoniobacter sp.]